MRRFFARTPLVPSVRRSALLRYDFFEITQNERWRMYRGAMGFVLFEATMVLAMVLILCAIGILGYDTLKKRSFIHDQAMIGLLLATAAMRAQSLHAEQVIAIDRGDAAFIFDKQRYQLSAPYRFGLLPDVYGPPSAPASLVTNPVTFIHDRITAHPDGTLQSGTLYITDGIAQYALTTPVSAFSYVRAYRYKDGSWQKY